MNYRTDMYMNGKKISATQLERFTDKLLLTLVDQLYDAITEDGPETFYPDDTYQQNKLVRKLLEYYQEREEYERCAVLYKKCPPKNK